MRGGGTREEGRSNRNALRRRLTTINFYAIAFHGERFNSSFERGASDARTKDPPQSSSPARNGLRAHDCVANTSVLSGTRRECLSFNWFYCFPQRNLFPLLSGRATIHAIIYMALADTIFRWCNSKAMLTRRQAIERAFTQPFVRWLRVHRAKRRSFVSLIHISLLLSFGDGKFNLSAAGEAEQWAVAED